MIITFAMSRVWELIVAFSYLSHIWYTRPTLYAIMRRMRKTQAEKPIRQHPGNSLSAGASRRIERVHAARDTHARTRVNCRSRYLIAYHGQSCRISPSNRQGSARRRRDWWNRPRLSLPPYLSLLPSPPPRTLVQLGLISTRKREIAIGAGERIRNGGNSSSSIIRSLYSTFHKIAYRWTAPLFFLSFSGASIGTGLISTSSTLWGYIQCAQKKRTFLFWKYI